MKNKLIMLFSVLVMVIAMAIPSFAAEIGWKKDSTEWQYVINKDGDLAADEFKKSGDTFFYLGEDSYLVRNKLISHDDAYYFIDENGAMTVNKWIKVDSADEDKCGWMYFGNNGKAVNTEDAKFKSIGDKKYHFTDYVMDYGFLDESGKMVEDDATYESYWYYCGSEDDGALKINAWIKVDADNDKGFVWLYFGSNGKKVVSSAKVINGVKYRFDDDGAMITSFWASPSDATPSVYYGENGSMVKKGWIWAKVDDDAEEFWYYAQNNGDLLKDCVKKINNKWYAFDVEGHMLTGFVWVANDAPVGEAIAAEDADINTFSGPGFYMYFAENADPNLQGWASVGKSVIECKDYKLTFNFNSKGIADANGFEIKKNYLYKDSILVNKEACGDTDYKYAVYEGEKIYVITLASGKASSKGTFTDTENELKYVFKNDTFTVYTKDNDGKYTVVTENYPKIN